MARAKLKLGLSCLGSLATQLGPEPRGLAKLQLSTGLNQSALSRKHIFLVGGERVAELCSGRVKLAVSYR